MNDPINDPRIWYDPRIWGDFSSTPKRVTALTKEVIPPSVPRRWYHSELAVNFLAVSSVVLATAMLGWLAWWLG